ncbi:MAG: L-histidine N(alpha)-methyltransferase [Cyanobacteria bacterium P01_A01_bin.135]
MLSSSPRQPTAHAELTPLESDASTAVESRLTIRELIDDHTLAEAEQAAADEVVSGLQSTPKTLPPRYFYDDLGSELFEQICRLPEYYLTRTETAILATSAGAIAEVTGPCDIVELGSGSSTKTRLILDAYSDQQPFVYRPIDVSAGILKSSARALLVDYPSLEVHGLVSTYEQALSQLPPPQAPHRLICFIGSTLGNLSPESCRQFLQQLRGALQPGDFFLLGVDLQKPVPLLEAAYNDAQGITAAFNLNMLRHLNDRFDGNFELAQFEHSAFYNRAQHQIEMHLRSRIQQTVHLKALSLTLDLAAGETIRSEISRKFSQEELEQDLLAQQLKPLNSWTDPKGWFSVTLAEAV